MPILPQWARLCRTISYPAATVQCYVQLEMVIMTNLFNKHAYETKEYCTEVYEEYVDVLLPTTDLEEDTVELHIPGSCDVKDMVTGTSL